MRLSVAVDGSNVSSLALTGEIEIRKDSTDSISTATVSFLSLYSTSSRFGSARFGVDSFAFEPGAWSEIVVTDQDTNRQFAGYITGIRRQAYDNSKFRFVCTCSDYGILLDRSVVSAVYANQSDEGVILDAMAGVPGITVNPSNITLIISNLATFELKDLTRRAVMDKVCDLSGGEWRVDYSGNLHYYRAGSVTAPFNVTDSSPNGVTSVGFSMDHLQRESSQLANRITVLGGFDDDGAEIVAISEDNDSQVIYGVLSATLVDRGLPDQATAQLKADAEIAQRALPLVSGQFTLKDVDGLDIGQTIGVTSSLYGLGADYLIRAIRVKQITNTKTEYQVTFGQKIPNEVSLLKRLIQAGKEPTYPPVAIPPPGSVTKQSLASTIEVIQPVASLPALPDPAYSANAVVFLTTNRKLFRRVGNNWTATVPAIDLVGQINDTQIEDDAISSPKIRALNILAEHLGANSVVAGKLAADSVVAGTVAAAAIRAVDAAFATAAIQSADVNTLSASKITAGIINALIEINSPIINAGQFLGGEIQIGFAGGTTMIMSAGGFRIFSDSNPSTRTQLFDTSIVGQLAGNTVYQLGATGGFGELFLHDSGSVLRAYLSANFSGRLSLWNNPGVEVLRLDASLGTSGFANAGGAAVPATAVGFLNCMISGSQRKIAYYDV